MYLTLTYLFINFLGKAGSGGSASLRDMRSDWRSMGCGLTPDGRLEVYGGDTTCQVVEETPDCLSRLPQQSFVKKYTGKQI